MQPLPWALHFVKRDATANVDAITSVDVGKMPDKNLADSLQRVVGVAVRTDYDEAEKVSMRGTNPDMSLILFNGHTVSGGDWYVSDQLSSSCSTSLSLMPSSVLNQALVYKTSQANLVDGGLAGTINVTTRKPLDEKKKFGGVISLGGVYADLPDKTSPQLNASMNWKNEGNTFGLIGQVFAEKRYIRRDSVSRFAYAGGSGWDVINTATMLGITDASLAGTNLKAAASPFTSLRRVPHRPDRHRRWPFELRTHRRTAASSGSAWRRAIGRRQTYADATVGHDLAAVLCGVAQGQALGKAQARTLSGRHVQELDVEASTHVLARLNHGDLRR